MTDKGYYIGIMSGTSSDGADAVLVRANTHFELIATHSHPFDKQLQYSIHQLADAQSASIDKLGEMDSRLGDVFAVTALELLQKAEVNPTEVIAIGSHGQTIRHRPSSTPSPFTIQIGDPNIIAHRTGITTVADFRRRDIAAGGQGAPLVPAFHYAIFSSREIDRAIINVGGMANISWLPKSQQQSVIGFDTGPGNVLLDGWIQQHLQQRFDQKGNWAAQGKINQTLLNLLLVEDFFQQPPPKSTGREVFNLNWLQSHLDQLKESIPPVDVQRTLIELTAKSIADSIEQLSTDRKEIFICGGGAFNESLMQRLKDLLSPNKVNSTADLGIDPQWVEAMAFAWLAQQRIENKPGNIGSVTGASEACVLGGIYFGANP
jgi:anhydro-N-acetylmuramic acid kinase